MATFLTPYIAFEGEAREAMQFYQDVFGGDLQMDTFGDFGQAGTPIEDQIMHAQLTTEDFRLMGSDTPPGLDRHPGRTVTLTLHGDDADRLRGYWDRLVDGGRIDMPLEKQMWGDVYGQCADKFGVIWMFNIAEAN